MSSTFTLTFDPSYNSGADFTLDGYTFSSSNNGFTYSSIEPVLSIVNNIKRFFFVISVL